MMVTTAMRLERPRGGRRMIEKAEPYFHLLLGTIVNVTVFGAH
jgi:hypothetical protein